MSSASPLALSCWRRVLIAWRRLGRAASLYALLTRFRAPTPPRVRFAPARPPTGRTARLAGVFACGGVLWCAGGAIAAAISVA